MGQWVKEPALSCCSTGSGAKKKPRIKQFHDGGASAMKNGIGRGKRELRFNL